ncbi:MAG: zinc ribbon domain-containing protein [Fimbriimonadaceae bacterium]|nr:zinc ribbon domain-containing protein [Fimbriimonadaceae bacterium]
MPIYEYEPDDRDCLMCPGRLQVIQSIHDEALRYCPDCGLEVKRVVSRASFKVTSGVDPGSRGFTKWKRSEYGVWEKVTGDGPDYLVGSDTDKATLQAEKSMPKVIDLDASN